MIQGLRGSGRWISIHAPARGATKLNAWIPRIFPNFNPRSRKGSDITPAGIEAAVKISIHAPARGATILHCSLVRLGQFQSTLPQGERPDGTGYGKGACDFNPRSRKGSDKALADTVIPPQKFQSTLPQGERPLAATCFAPSK